MKSVSLLTFIIVSLTACAQPTPEAPAKIDGHHSAAAAASTVSSILDESPKVLSVISWNVKHLGRSSMDLDAIYSMLTSADIVTFQEVNRNNAGQEALKQIAERLAKYSQTKFCRALSEFPSGDKNERYAYIWRNDRIAFVRSDGSVLENCPDNALTVRLGLKNADRIAREPAVGTFQFKATKKNFVLASIHLVPTGKNPSKEVEPLFETFAEMKDPVLVAGDYNLDSNVRAFSSATERGFRPAMLGEKTSLKKNSRELSRAYDNFWFRKASLKRRTVLNLHKAFPGLGAKHIYRNISDHNPIQAEFLLE